MLAIVIGLPGSGKTYFSNSLGIKVYDDFIRDFYSGNLVKDLKNNIDVCINDPRLCNYETFQKFITIFERIIKKDNIILYLFQNDAIKCKMNANKKVEKFIETYSVLYDPYNYKGYNCNILPVYSQINLQ